jgi:mono/diheme cytochrome c family protein
MKLKFLPTVLLVGVTMFFVALLSGNILWTSDKPPLQIIDDMDDQPKVKPQVASTFFADGKATREPLEYTVPINGTKYAVSLDEADTKNVNPIQSSELVLARGRNRFNSFCAPCHNYDGKGNGLVVQKGFSNPPSLLENAKSYSDGKIFHIISAGQNIMSSYADKTSEADRWCIVHYIRALQNGTVTPTPMPAQAQVASSGEPAAAQVAQK